MTDTYRIRSDETWAKARDDYLAGEPARVVCRRYDLGESAFNKRAREEGWRRCDQPDPEPVVREVPPARPFADTVLDALARADDALRRGKPAECRKFLDLAEHYETLAWLEEDRLQTCSLRLLKERREREAMAAAGAALEAESPQVQKVQKVQ